MINYSRRNALKFIGASALLTSGVGATTKLEASENKDITQKIVILGAGLAGISLAAKIRREMPNAKVVLVDKDETFIYQPGLTLVGIGFYTKDDITFDKAKYIPNGAEWIKQNVAQILPDENSVKLENGEILNYDYLVVALGIKYEFEAVKGLSIDDINSPSGNISSIYTLAGAVKTNELMQKFANNGGNAIFIDQKTPMKCSGANKKMLAMSEDRLRLAGNRTKGSVHLYAGGGKLFGDPTYAAKMSQIFIERDIKFTLRHQIIEIDKARNTVVFEHWMPYRENGEDRVATEQIEVKFDWLHLPPKQVCHKLLAEAGLTKDDDKLNWLSVNKKTLQSTKYKNIFGIGDIVGTPIGKTGASVRKMYPLVATNIANTIKGKELEASYNGYTACPFITKYGKAIMVEFDWDGTASSISCFGATRESYMSWLTKLYGFRPMIMNGMLKGLV